MKIWYRYLLKCKLLIIIIIIIMIIILYYFLVQEELGKRLKMNINTEKKLIKEVTLSHETERKSFETKMKVRKSSGIDNDNPLTVF